ncbi:MULTISPECIES: WG repeat-containing protein [unclassified Burkholderia]|uniref:WG repeat-containing protein n=1 Tax=unclassified Burkholderia TaxID=2613784 RepID=UPI00141EF891|nr:MULTISPECIES: WG repeat-containing protein [unclassified Burkholderia]NIE61176.1 hypothetical protein [Burkholderia sp. Ap-955]NIF13268.1 hypothetical protein [Burkholderia sp. Ax-1735]NIG06507.1 hypothetical protein [Burkholderia sp. Tr-849]
MGNRSFLYIQAGSGEEAKTIEVADANNNFPTLWRILLASSAAGEAIRDQRVFGDANSDNLVSDARAALDRLRTLLSYLERNPVAKPAGNVFTRFIAKPPHLSDEESQLVRQLDAAIHYLQNEVDDLAEYGVPDFSANLDELFALEGFSDFDEELASDDEYSERYFADASDEFIRREAGKCNALWGQLQVSMSKRDTVGVRELLLEAEVTRVDCSVPVTWDYWAWTFGVSGFDHAYFNRAYGEAPRTVTFKDFMATSGGKLGHQLAYGLYSFHSEGRWGVQYADEKNWRIVQEATWDGMWKERGDAAYFLCWVKRNEKYGLIRPEEKGVITICEPGFDDFWYFEGRTAFVQVGDKIGLIGVDGVWLLEPCLDECSDYEEGYAWAAVGKGYGFLGEDGQWSVPPKYEEIGDICWGVSAAMRSGEQWGLMELASGQWLSAPQWHSLEWSEERTAFLVGPDKTIAMDARGQLLSDSD